MNLVGVCGRFQLLCNLFFAAGGRQIYCLPEGREAFRQLARLCGDPNLVGIRLLDHISTLPLSELSCSKLFNTLFIILFYRDLY